MRDTWGEKKFEKKGGDQNQISACQSISFNGHWKKRTMTRSLTRGGKPCIRCDGGVDTTPEPSEWLVGENSGSVASRKKHRKLLQRMADPAGEMLCIQNRINQMGSEEMEVSRPDQIVKRGRNCWARK